MRLRRPSTRSVAGADEIFCQHHPSQGPKIAFVYDPSGCLTEFVNERLHRTPRTIFMAGTSIKLLRHSFSTNIRHHGFRQRGADTASQRRELHDQFDLGKLRALRYCVAAQIVANQRHQRANPGRHCSIRPCQSACNLATGKSPHHRRRHQLRVPLQRQHTCVRRRRDLREHRVFMERSRTKLNISNAFQSNGSSVLHGSISGSDRTEELD